MYQTQSHPTSLMLPSRNLRRLRTALLVVDPVPCLSECQNHGNVFPDSFEMQLLKHCRYLSITTTC